MATLNPQQVAIIKSTVPILKEHGNAITAHFYKTMLAEHPKLNDIFNRANQANGHQASALAYALYAYAAHIDDLGVLSPAIEKICHKHASLYIRPEHYKVVGEYLLRAMGDVLGDALTPDVLQAWGAAYWQLANVLIGREERLYEQADTWADWRDFRIAKKERESSEITSFYLEPVDGQALPRFLPGQYISVRIAVPRLGHLQPRQYSLSDAPNSKYYRISVKQEAGVDASKPGDAVFPGYVSNILHDEKDVGDVLQVSHPYGEFFLDPAQAQSKPVVLLSAGVGVTPMVSIAHTLLATDTSQRLSFIHGSRSSASRAFHPHLEGLASQHPNMNYTSFVKESETVRNGESKDCTFRGRLSLDRLNKRDDLFLDDGTTQYYVCGPEGFMRDVQRDLLTMGADQDRIHLELFGTGVAGESEGTR